ncbi:MAG: cytochrome P460 [Gammaproteobacteria bacterium HGW-Gammaproteobacteria-3]|nr:MAG: cytochrome P460 [Gammaproteobacteria bacterium HGW-Gammaproteobacteria-3]
MNNKSLGNMIRLAALTLAFTQPAYSGEAPVQAAPNGIEMPKYYKNWRVIGVSHRTDNHSLRAILGNSIAIDAARSGNTRPWPDGAVLAKLVWKDTEHPDFPDATVPGELLHAEFMIKDGRRYKTTEGWGFARWLGMAQKPYGDNADFAKECASCHARAKDSDFVFTRPAELP